MFINAKNYLGDIYSMCTLFVTPNTYFTILKKCKKKQWNSTNFIDLWCKNIGSQFGQNWVKIGLKFEKCFQRISFFTSKKISIKIGKRPRSVLLILAVLFELQEGVEKDLSNDRYQNCEKSLKINRYYTDWFFFNILKKNQEKKR